MRFEGQIWFDFSTPSVWMFYQWVRLLAQSGARVALEWVPLPKGTERAAMATLLSIDDPQDRGRYLHGMLGLVHMEQMPATHLDTVRAALSAAGLDPNVVVDNHAALEGLRARATAIGVDAVPSLHRHGPVVSIQFNPAVLSDDPREVAETIDRVMSTDGIWELRKP